MRTTSATCSRCGARSRRPRHAPRRRPPTAPCSQTSPTASPGPPETSATRRAARGTTRSSPASTKRSTPRSATTISAPRCALCAPTSCACAGWHTTSPPGWPRAPASTASSPRRSARATATSPRTPPTSTCTTRSRASSIAHGQRARHPHDPARKEGQRMTVTHHLRVHRSDEQLAREGQLAWRIAEIAADPVEVDADVVDMIINRVIDNAAVAAASLTRAPVSAARAAGAGPPGVGRTDPGPHLRLRTRAPHQPGVGGVGERRGRARAGLPRHVPRRRVLAPGRQHPADPRRRAARRIRRPRPRPRHRDGLRDPDRPGEGDQPARAQDRPRRAPRSLGRRRHRHPARPRRRDDLPGGRARRCTPPPPPGRAARARSPPGRRTPRLRREDGGRGRGPGDARGDLAEPDLRGRGRRDRLDARRP